MIAQSAFQSFRDEPVHAFRSILGGDVCRDPKLLEVIESEEIIPGASPVNQAGPPALRPKL